MLTHAGIAAENYPFSTIEPNVGIVGVPDSHLQALADIVHPQRIVPMTMKFVDITGLWQAPPRATAWAPAT